MDYLRGKVHYGKLPTNAQMGNKVDDGGGVGGCVCFGAISATHAKEQIDVYQLIA